LSGSMNGRIEDKGYQSPDFKMTTKKIIYEPILFYQWLNCYLKFTILKRNFYKKSLSKRLNKI